MLNPVLKINIYFLFIFVKFILITRSNNVNVKCVGVSGTTRTFDCIFQDIANDKISCVAEKHQCQIEKSSSSISVKDGFRSVRITLHITKFDTEDIQVKICRIVESDDSLNECEHKDSSILLEQMVKIKYPVDVQISCSQLHESTTDLQQVYECSAFSITPINRFDISCESGIYCQLDSDKVIENTKEWPIIQTQLTVITTEQSCPKTDHPVIIKIKNEATNVDVQKSIPITTRCTGKKLASDSLQDSEEIYCDTMNKFGRIILCSITSVSEVKSVTVTDVLKNADYTQKISDSIKFEDEYSTSVLIYVRIRDHRMNSGKLSFTFGVVTEVQTKGPTLVPMNFTYILYPYERPHINCTRVATFEDFVEYDPSWECRLLKLDSHLPKFSPPKDYTLEIKDSYLYSRNQIYLHYFTVIFKSISRECSSSMTLPTQYNFYNSENKFTFSNTINCQKFSASCEQVLNTKMLECEVRSKDTFSELRITCDKYMLCGTIPNVNTKQRRIFQEFKVIYELKSFTPNMRWVLTIHAFSSNQRIPMIKHLKFSLKKTVEESASLACKRKDVVNHREVDKSGYTCSSRIPSHAHYIITVHNPKYTVSNTFIKLDKDKFTDFIESSLILTQDKSLCHQTETVDLILQYEFDDTLYQSTYEITINPTCIESTVKVEVSNTDKIVYLIIESSLIFDKMNITCSSEVRCQQAVDITRKNTDGQSKAFIIFYFVYVYKIWFTTATEDKNAPLLFNITANGHDSRYNQTFYKEINVTYIPDSSDSEQISCSKVSSNPFEMWIDCEIMSTHQQVIPVFENDYQSECQKYTSENNQSSKLSVFKCRLYSKIPKCSDSPMIITYNTETKNENLALPHTTMTYQSDCDYFEMNECVSTDEFGRSHNCIIKSISHTLDLFCEAKHMICKIHTEQLSHSLQLYQWRVFIELISAEIPIYIIDDPIKVMVVRKNTKKETGKSTFEATLKLKPEEITSESCSQKELVSTNNLISFECVIISRFPLKFEAMNQSQYSLTPVILNQTTSGISLKVIVLLQITSNVDLHLLPHELEYLVCDSEKGVEDKQCLTIMLAYFHSHHSKQIRKFSLCSIAIIFVLSMIFQAYRICRRRFALGYNRRFNRSGDRNYLMQFDDSDFN